ncbi:NUDIX hydrolase [Glycomyces sp. MUSA5-2]|uniref:NUDIX hydrolase n=1 Tax=Glycomyces sp. MUSA5-2 TaxID=2053002 RepID=UPI00300BD86C
MQPTEFEALLAAADQEGIAQVVVGAVITDSDGRVLLLQRLGGDFMGGLWELPSGTREPGEALQAALAREVAEETGLALASIDAYLGAFDYTSGSGKSTRQFTFAITTAQTAPVRLTEHDEYQWRSPGEDPPVSDAVKALLGSIAGDSPLD